MYGNRIDGNKYNVHVLKTVEDFTAKTILSLFKWLLKLDT